MNLKRATFGLLTSTMLCTSGAVFAQDTVLPTAAAATTPASDEGDIIIVTAQKRSENLQHVPISIQALGAQQLEEQNVSNFQDYTRLLPSISYQTLEPGTTNVYIRGVASGGDGNHSGSLPSVGVYLDEQPVTTIGGTLDVHIYDIARIEVLRGPQGTLYGASSEAGTIRIITNRPDPSGFSGAMDAQINSVEHGDIGGSLQGYLNVPLSDRAALRVVGWYQHDAGYIDNVPGTRAFLPQPGGIVVNNAPLVENNYNDVDVVGGRLALGIELADNWTVTASLIGQDQHSHGSFGYDPSVGDLDVQRFYPERRHDRFGQAALTIEGRIGNFDLTYAGAYMERTIHSSADYTDYAEAYDSLYAAAGGLANYFYFLDNGGNTIDPSQHIIGYDRFTKMSHELRIASPAANRLRFVGGLFYQRQFHRIHQDYQVTGLGNFVSVNGRPGTLWLTQQDRVDRDYAAFGEMSFDILPTLTLTGGLRVYRYDNSLIGFFGFGRNPGGGFTDTPFNAAGSSRTGVIQCLTTTGATLRDNLGGTLLPPAVEGSPCTNLAEFENGQAVPKNTTGDGITYRVNLTWNVTPRHLLYATWSRGFRPGGINRRTTIAPYDEDTLTNYELGFKTTWPGNFRLNGAFFWQEWRKFQYSFLGQNSFTEIHNGPNARIRGVELELNWRPIPAFNLSASAAYTDAETRQNLCLFDDPTFTCAPPGNLVSSPPGTRLPVTPRFKMASTARYEFPLAGGTGHVQGALAYQSSATADLRRLIIQSGTGNLIDPAVAIGRLESYATVDFAFGVEWQRFSAELFVENAFDERAQLTRFVLCGQCFQRPYIVTNTPRTFGLRVGTRF
jgi:outer membrane receptor protein involved in Fe transport